MTSSSKGEVVVVFRTQYTTFVGQQLFVLGDHPELGNWVRESALKMTYVQEPSNPFNWTATIRLRVPANKLIKMQYKYIVLTSTLSAREATAIRDVRFERSAEICWDTGPNRTLIISVEPGQTYNVETRDLFQSPFTSHEHLLLKNTFRKVVYSHNIEPGLNITTRPKVTEVQVCFRVIPMQVPPGYQIMIAGDRPLFGNWNMYLPLKPIDDLYWEYKCAVPQGVQKCEYKYVIRSPDGKYSWEKRPNRTLYVSNSPPTVYIVHDWLFQAKTVNFRGAGLILGLYSIRSKNSHFRIGEFRDLIKVIDWAVKANMLLIQLLPLQDTRFFGAKEEDNPSRLVSAFAFNPMYLSLDSIPGCKIENIQKSKKFYDITTYKLMILRKCFDSIKDKTLIFQDQQFLTFIEENKNWLIAYCAWCVLRETESKSPRPTDQWPLFNPTTTYNVMQPPVSDSDNNILFYAWVQFWCHKQVLSITQYARSKRVVLSCMMTIGQSKYSADLWSRPQLFDVAYTIGAPPDFFSFHGQNWGYPSWKWNSEGNATYHWLREQLTHRETYFDACQFDHPLGLFRSWNIPSETKNPLFGHFVPSIAIDLKDLHDLQIRDIARLCRAEFPISDVLSLDLKEDVKEKLINSLATYENFQWRFRSDIDSDNSIKNVIKRLSSVPGNTVERKLQFRLAKKILLSHFESICLVPDSEEPHRKYYPRFSMTDSNVFRGLPERDAQVLYKLFVDFYYRTNFSLWHDEGDKKLSVLAASSMQFFGYDLGASLNDEEKALHKAGICSYRVQRIPRESTLRFDSTNSFPYMSVCTTTPHDLPNLRIWWTQEQADVQQFYHQILKMGDDDPEEINPAIAEGIIKLHMMSKSMWCVLLFEDLFTLSHDFDDLVDTFSPRFSWKYRMPITLEELLEDHEDWTNIISKLIEQSGRGRSASNGIEEAT